MEQVERVGVVVARWDIVVLLEIELAGVDIVLVAAVWSNVVERLRKRDVVVVESDAQSFAALEAALEFAWQGMTLVQIE